jgi:diaminohydroxyphosphoribosylaminopyrimidine deaminase/5-amino-6-(5-phosphoribosylamino)uracil reductase
VDEVHVFIANKLVGGAQAPTPLAGIGIELMPQAVTLYEPTVEQLEGDIYLHGRTTNAVERLFARIGQRA